MPASTIQLPLPSWERARVRGSGASRLNTELPAFTLIPAFCLRGPPLREKGQKQSMPASTIVIPSPLVGEGQGEGGGVSRFNTELPAFTIIPTFCLRGPPSRENE